MTQGYTHGPITCRDCFHDNEDILKIGEWRLHNNPGYYGSQTPEILVLGFSKGANQNKAAALGDFDKIAFADARHRLQQVLEALGLMPQDRSIDDLMTAKEKQFGVASLVRCSFCKMDEGKCKTSGAVIPSAFSNAATRRIIVRCAENYLAKLPPSTKLVVLLGTDDRYIKNTKAIARSLYRDFEDGKEVSFKAGGALWVYGTHPSPGNGCFSAWRDKGHEDKSGGKRIAAQQALEAWRSK